MPVAHAALRATFGDVVVYRRPSVSLTTTSQVTIRMRRQLTGDPLAYLAKVIPADLPYTPEAGDELIHDGGIYRVVGDIAQTENGLLTLNLRFTGPSV